MVKKLALVLLFTITATGCSAASNQLSGSPPGVIQPWFYQSLEKPEQPAITELIPLSEGNSLGQTFVARYDGLQAVTLYLEPDSHGNGTLELRLRVSPQDSTVLRSASLPLGNITAPGYYRLNFPPIDGSKGQYYDFLARVKGPGSVQVGSAAGHTYVNGSRYLNNIPQEGQLTFNLAHNRSLALTALLSEGLYWLAMLAIGVFLFVIPGWALLSLFLPGWETMHWAEKLGLGSGVSLSIYPILLLWTNLVGLHLGPLYAWLPPVLGIATLFWKNRSRFSTFKPSDLKIPGLTDITLIIIFGLIFAVRFWVIRGLDLPLFGDSIHHTMIAQLIADHGGLFKIWQPYAELQTMTYHFGFHSLTAAFHWVTHLSISQATLWVGQILNGLAVIAIFPLAMRVTLNKWGGIAAVLIAGLLFSLPMYYVNWGRYTQIAGMTILPGVICLAWMGLREKQTWRSSIPLWIALGGLALTHYRLLIFVILFFVTVALLEGRDVGIRQVIAWIARSGIIPGLLFLPWFIHVFAGKIFAILNHQISKPVSQGANMDPVGNLLFYLPAIAWVVLPIIVGWGLWRRDKRTAIISLWWFLILLVANPQWLNLPGAGVLENFTVFAAAYFPASVLLGGAFGRITQDLHKKVVDSPGLSKPGNTAMPVLSRVILFALMISLSLWGARKRILDLDIPSHALATRPDLRAATWIQENIPDNTRFLVNSFFAYNGSVIAGSDGGWWLPLLTEHLTSQPCFLYGMEEGPWPGYRIWANALTAEINQKGVTHPDVLSMLDERGLEFVYIGQRQGSVNNPAPFLNPGELMNDPHFDPVYHQDRVWIFQVVH